MHDDEIHSNCSSEENVYERFKARLKEKYGRGDDENSFRDRLGDNLDDMLDDPVDK